MASRRKRVAKAVPFKAADLAAVTKATPYIKRLIEDSELQDNVRTAYESSRSAYERLQRAKRPQKAVLEDKRLQKDTRIQFVQEGQARDKPHAVHAAPSGKDRD